MTESAEPISSKPPCRREDAIAVLKRLRDQGHVAYFAGGCVRDELMGLVPKDYDVATDAAPKRVRELFRNTQAVGAAFGVILVRLGPSVVEVATFRSDGDYLDGRRPSEVHFTTAEQDAKRRDFTINGLFLDPLSNKVIDYVGGLEDLKARRLRAIGDPAARFGEDHLRLLRAVRFAARFELQIDPATDAAIRAHAQRLTIISPERIAEELRKMLVPSTRQTAWPMLERYGLSDVIFRFAPPAATGADHPMRALPLALDESPAALGLVLAAAAVGRSGDPAALLCLKAAQAIDRAMRQALRISNEESDDLIGALAGVGYLLEAPDSLARRKRFLARPTAELSRRLMRALTKMGYESQALAALDQVLEALHAADDYAPPPLITGDDLTAAGLRPGRLFKRILDEAYDAQLEARIETRQEAMALAMKIAGEATGPSSG
jgi:poly(A) polymerase